MSTRLRDLRNQSESTTRRFLLNSYEAAKIQMKVKRLGVSDRFYNYATPPPPRDTCLSEILQWKFISVDPPVQWNS